MAVFIATNNAEPYQKVDWSNIVEQTATVDGTVGAGTTTIEGTLYLVATEELYPSLTLLVENETVTGVSLYISPTDLTGNPTHWGKQIIYTDVDATNSNQHMMFKYKWEILNNIYIIKRHHASVAVNVYQP